MWMWFQVQGFKDSVINKNTHIHVFMPFGISQCRRKQIEKKMKKIRKIINQAKGVFMAKKRGNLLILYTYRYVNKKNSNTKDVYSRNRNIKQFSIIINNF